jgi:ABC-2 type transport system permease protein
MRMLPVVRREFLERVRTKAFVIGTFVGPVLMAGFMIGPAFLAQRQRGKPQRVAIIDQAGGLRADVEDALGRRKEGGENRFLIQSPPSGSGEAAKASLKQEVLAGRLDGFLTIPEDVLETSKAEYSGRTVSNQFDIRQINRAVEEAVVARRLASEGLDSKRVRNLTRGVELKRIRISEGGDREDRGVTFIFSTILMMMLYVTTLMWGQALMTGVIERRPAASSSWPSSMSPWSLLSGKLLGIGGAGLLQLLVWVFSMAAISAFGAPMLAASEVPMPEITPLILISYVIFFLLGFFLYASLYAAVGASVNTVQEAQSLVFPVMMPLILSVMFFPFVLQNPTAGSR